VARDQIMTWLWHDVTSRDRGDKRLGTAVSRLRDLGVPIIGDGRIDPYLWLERYQVHIDDAWLATASAHDLLHHDLRVLPHYTPNGPPAMHEWLDSFRRQAQLRVTNALQRNARLARQDGHHAVADALECRMAELTDEQCDAGDQRDGHTQRSGAPVLDQPPLKPLLYGQSKLRNLIG